MAANWVGPGSDSRLDDNRAVPNLVITLSDRRMPSLGFRPAAGLKRNISAIIHDFGAHFTPADQRILAAWALDTSHGYDRLHVERGVLEDGTWTSYALAYVPGQAWSTWGLMRRGDHVEVWQCANGKNLGRYPRMVDALASLPHATNHRRALATAAAVRVGSRRHDTF